MASGQKAKSIDNRKRILLVDDHPIVRQGLTQLIAQEPGMTVCGEAESPAEAMKKIKEERPAAAVVDLSLKGGRGLDLIKDIKANHPEVLVLVFSMYDEEAYAERAIRSGARGYVMKGGAPGTVTAALKEVLSGGIHLSPAISKEILLKVAAGDVPKTCDVQSLTDSELDVFRMLGEGLTTAQIAQRLHRSRKTINSHRENIKKKLNCRNSVALLQEATRWVESASR